MAKSNEGSTSITSACDEAEEALRLFLQGKFDEAEAFVQQRAEIRDKISNAVPIFTHCHAIILFARAGISGTEEDRHTYGNVSSSSSPSSSDNSPNVIGDVMKTEREGAFQKPSSISTFGSNFSSNQHQEMDQIVQRLENIHMYGDANEAEPKGDVNYALPAAQKVTVSDFEPSCYEQSCTNDLWLKAMQEEMNTIMKNDTWELCELPKGKRCVGSKWTYKTKYNSVGSIERSE